MAGICFILPAMVLVLIFAILYSQYGNIPNIEGIFQGIKPVILAVVVQSVYRLSKFTLDTKASIFIFMLALLLAFLGVSEIIKLLAMAVLIFLVHYVVKFRSFHLVIEPVSVGVVFLIFLKIGSILYGSGYVLLVFIQSEFVDRYGVVTSKQLLDAV